MIKEAKNVDFYTTGKQPSEQDFARISEWIKKDKQKQVARKEASQHIGKKHLAQESIAKSKDEE